MFGQRKFLNESSYHLSLQRAIEDFIYMKYSRLESKFRKYTWRTNFKCLMILIVI